MFKTLYKGKAIYIGYKTDKLFNGHAYLISIKKSWFKERYEVKYAAKYTGITYYSSIEAIKSNWKFLDEADL